MNMETETKTIVCYGDSNTWGFVPVAEDAETVEHARFPCDVRWTGVLARLLGEGYHVLEEGLNGRTTAYDDLLGKYRNGAKYLGVCLATHKPVDLLVFMLGVNDTKKHLLLPAAQIGRGVEKLIKIARSDDFGPGGLAPEILIVSPVRIREEILSSWLWLEFDQSSALKSYELAEIFYNIAKRRDCYYMNAAAYAEASATDGLHLDAENHRKLAEALHKKIIEIEDTF